MLVCAFLDCLLRTRSRVQRAPGLPCALSSEGPELSAKLGRMLPRERGRVFVFSLRHSGARSCASPESITPVLEFGVKPRLQGVWIPGLRQVAHPQVRNCAPGNDELGGSSPRR